MNRRWIAAAAVALALTGCTPLRMGESQATLTRLLEGQAHCDAAAKKPPLEVRRAIECREVADGLAKLAGELAEEARKPGTSAANAVFFYRRAATAAWRSEQPKAMQDAVTYARAGAQLCPRERQASEIPPGDCALMHLMFGLVAHDEGVLAYRSLLASTPGSKPERQRRLFGNDHDKPLDASSTPMGTASGKSYAGWIALREAMPQACRAGVDESVRAYVGTVHGDMVMNLQRVHEQVFLAADRVFTDADYAGACEVLAAQDGRAIGVRFKSQSTDILRERANGETWCRWQFAKQNPPACPAVKPPL